MRLKDYRDFLAQIVKKESNQSNFDTYLDRIIDLAVRKHVNSYAWRELMYPDTFATVADQESYIIPAYDFGHMLGMYHKEYSTYCPIGFENPRNFFTSYASTTQTGIPAKACIVKGLEALDQLSSASVMSVVSSSSSDTGITVKIYGIVSSYPDSEEFTLNGTTQVDGTKSFSLVYGMTKSASTVGRISALNSDDDTVMVIPTGKQTQEARYIAINMRPIPADAYTIYFNYRRRQYRLIDDDDFCILGDDHDPAILFLAQYLVYNESSAKKMYDECVSDLKANDSPLIEETFIQSRFNQGTNVKLPSMGTDYADLYL